MGRNKMHRDSFWLLCKEKKKIERERRRKRKRKKKQGRRGELQKKGKLRVYFLKILDYIILRQIRGWDSRKWRLNGRIRKHNLVLQILGVEINRYYPKIIKCPHVLVFSKFDLTSRNANQMNFWAVWRPKDRSLEEYTTMPLYKANILGWQCEKNIRMVGFVFFK